MEIQLSLSIKKPNGNMKATNNENTPHIKS